MNKMSVKEALSELNDLATDWSNHPENKDSFFDGSSYRELQEYLMSEFDVVAEIREVGECYRVFIHDGPNSFDPFENEDATVRFEEFLDSISLLKKIKAIAEEGKANDDYETAIRKISELASSKKS